MKKNDNIIFKLLSVTKTWSDLPQDIQGLVLERLTYVDQIRFRAVCKNWLVPKDPVKCSDWIPWMVSLKNYPSELELFDPNSQNSYTVTNPKEKFHGYIEPGERTIIYASKFGWLLLGREHSLLWLHNPFTNETLFLPILISSTFLKATFTTDPKSPGCEILVFSRASNAPRRYCYNGLTYINRYHISSDTDKWSTRGLGRNRYGVLSKDMGSWRRQVLGDYGYDYCLKSIHYMNGKIYCMLPSLFIMCYDLADKSWTKLKADMPPAPNDEETIYHWLDGTRNVWKKCLLTGKGENLLMVCRDRLLEFKVFDYDWSNMCWAEAAAALYKDATFFIKDDEVILSSMLEQERRCMVFYVDCYGKSGCFSLKQSEKEEQKVYNWTKGARSSTMNIIEPHYFRNYS